jgi:hypothetical protein
MLFWNKDYHLTQTCFSFCMKQTLEKISKLTGQSLNDDRNVDRICIYENILTMTSTVSDPIPVKYKQVNKTHTRKHKFNRNQSISMDTFSPPATSPREFNKVTSVVTLTHFQPHCRLQALCSCIYVLKATSNVPLVYLFSN